MSVAIIAALPREIAGLVRGLKPDEDARSSGVSVYRRANAVVVAAGMGSARVSLAVEAALSVGGVETLISAGLAGACGPTVPAASLLHAGTVIDARTGERFETSDTGASAVLVSTDSIASASEKKRLHESYRAAMVDMEAATVGRLARAHRLSFQAIKGISDAHDFEIEGLSRFADGRGQFQTARFAVHTALRPHTWGAAIELGRNSEAALKKLTAQLFPLLGA